MQIPNAVELGGRVSFVTELPGADVIADRVGGKARCMMPPEYETLTLRRMFWQEQGLHYDELAVEDVQEITLCLELERAHPERFRQKSG